MTPRTLIQIKQSLIDNVPATYSTSAVAEWRLWVDIFAIAIYAFEQIMSLFQTEITTTIQQKQPSSFAWYYEKILEFQGTTVGGTFTGDNLIVDSYGIVRYENVDESHRIITECKLRANAGTLAVKLAKYKTATENQALTASEQLAFAIYMNKIKYPGTTINIISKEADIIVFDIEIIYDPAYSTATIETNYKAKLAEYRASMEFDDSLYDFKLLKAITDAEGVISVKRTSITCQGVSDVAPVEIDIVVELESGYFNFDYDNSTIVLTDYTTL